MYKVCEKTLVFGGLIFANLKISLRVSGANPEFEHKINLSFYAINRFIIEK